MGKSKKSTWQGAAAQQAAGGGPQRRRGPAATVADDFALSDSDDEQDDFAAHRDKVSIGSKKGGKRAADMDEEGADGMDEEVMGLGEEEDDEDDEEGEEGDDEGEEDDDDDDALIERALERGGRAAELAKQAKAIGSKLKLQRREDEDGGDGDDREEAGVPGGQWGGNKNKYYDADTAELEGSDAEEALQEEMEEVVRLEKAKAARLKASDFGLEHDEEEEDEEEEEGEEEEEDEQGEATLGAVAKKQGKQAEKRGAGARVVETVPKQLDALSAEEREAALLADAPELLALLQDLTDSLKEVRQRVGPVLQEVRSGGLATADGISYLEAKHLLLLQYCTHIVFYILLKAEGRPVKDHPVIARLVELRAYLEKIRPIDKRLQYQVDRLIKAAQVAARQEGQGQPSASGRGGDGAEAEDGAADDGDALKFGPRRDQLVSKGGPAGKAAKAEGGGGGDGEAGGGGVYRPPKINPVTMEGDVDRAELTRNEGRLLKEARRKASRSALVRELAEEVGGAPRELRQELPGYDSMAAVKQRQRMQAREAVEEDMMSRVPLSKEEAKKMRQQQRAGMSGKAMLDDFADEVADIVGMSQAQAGGKSRLADLFNRQKVSQKFGAELPRAAAHGGDEDLPRRAPLGDRRVKFDAVAARRSAAAAASAMEDDGDEGAPDSEFFGGGGGRRGGKRKGGEEDELYQEVKAAAAERKRAKQEKHAAQNATHPPLADATAAGSRGITREIEKNKGLTPHRRKDLKNPRKKHRIMFEKAQVRRKGAVQSMRSPTANYGGEETGVKSRVVKSRKLG